MNKLNLIIIEDDFFAAKHLKDELTKLGHQVKKIFYSGEHFIKAYKQLEFDAAIVDIQLSEKANGFDLASILNSENKPFSFLTANEEQSMIQKAIQYKPVSYISKPFKINDIIATLELISLKVPSFIKIRTNLGVKYIDPNTILFVKADSSYIEIHTNDSVIIQRKLLKDFVNELPDFFIRVHRSYVVNKRKIILQNSKYIQVKNKKIPRSRKSSLSLQ